MHFGEQKALNVKQRINLEREPMRHAMQQLQLHLETIELHDGAASPHRDSAASAEEHHVAQPGEHKQINKTDHRACYGEQVCQQLEAAELIAGASSGDSSIARLPTNLLQRGSTTRMTPSHPTLALR